MDEKGTFRMKFKADGILTAIPVNPLTGEAVGDPLEVVVKETHQSYLNDSDCSVSSSLFQKLLPTSDPNSGWFVKRLKINSKSNNGFEIKTSCNEF